MIYPIFLIFLTLSSSSELLPRASQSDFIFFLTFSAAARLRLPPLIAELVSLSLEDPFFSGNLMPNSSKIDLGLPIPRMRLILSRSGAGKCFSTRLCKHKIEVIFLSFLWSSTSWDHSLSHGYIFVGRMYWDKNFNSS